jgi:hypothetical protein
MITYILDLKQLNSVSILPDTESLVELCYEICLEIASKLMRAIPEPRDVRGMRLALSFCALQQYFGHLGMTILETVQENKSINVHYTHVISCMPADSNGVPFQEITMENHPEGYLSFLVGLIAEILESMILSLRSRSPPLSDSLLNECVIIFNSVISELFLLFPIPADTIPLIVEKIQVKVDFCDQNVEIGNVV